MLSRTTLERVLSGMGIAAANVAALDAQGLNRDGQPKATNRPDDTRRTQNKS